MKQNTLYGFDKLEELTVMFFFFLWPKTNCEIFVDIFFVPFLLH